jgi:hypothetical protein
MKDKIFGWQKRVRPLSTRHLIIAFGKSLLGRTIQKIALFSIPNLLIYSYPTQLAELLKLCAETYRPS